VLFGSLKVEVGEPVVRRQLHAQVRGSWQGGISPWAQAPYVFVFSDPTVGERHGYVDRWDADGVFHYTGEGQFGDQVMANGNRAIRDHAADGRELHVFVGQGKRKPLIYQGRFEYLSDYPADAPETGGGPERKVIRFRLGPIGAAAASVPANAPAVLPKVTTVTDVPVEQHFTEWYTVNPGHAPTSAERKEAGMVAVFCDHEAAHGRRFTRERIDVAGELAPLYCDLYDPASNLLVEAKGSVTRGHLRMAIGQLLDYCRFITPAPELAILLPERPRPDLVELAASCGVSLIVRSKSGFERL